MFTTLVFLWSLTFTAPSLNSHINFFTPIGCRDTTAGTTPLTDLAGFYIIRHRLSPTWALKGAMMWANPDTFNVYWPVVRTEAAWQGYVTVPCQTIAAGKTQTITIADTSHVWAYAICPKDLSGNFGCMSNEVRRP